MSENALLELGKTLLEAYGIGKPVAVFIKKRLDQKATWDPIRSLSGSTTVFQSNLFAIPHDAYVMINGQRVLGAPFIKPMGQKLALVPAGYPITGLWDAQGMMYLSAVLGANEKPFVISHDQKDAPLDSNIISFGSAASNIITGQIIEKLTDRIRNHVEWRPDAFGFKVNGTEFKSGELGMILSYTSPWNSAKRAVVLAGLGPAGTLGAAKMFAQWPEDKVDLLKLANGKYVAAVSLKDLDGNPELRAFQTLE